MDIPEETRQTAKAALILGALWWLWHVPAVLFSAGAVGGIEQGAAAVVLVIVFGRQYLGRQNLYTEPTPGAAAPGDPGALLSKNYT